MENRLQNEAINIDDWIAATVHLLGTRLGSHGPTEHMGWTSAQQVLAIDGGKRYMWSIIVSVIVFRI